MELLFASSNVNKLQEIRQLLPKGFKLISLEDLNYRDELEETTETLEGNALQKAYFIYHKFGIACFADDSGLEVEVLNGKPGVHSAFYAGLPRNDSNNMKFLHMEMGHSSNRRARFRTVIAYVGNGIELLFEGTLEGEIAMEAAGENGFGYDPVFIPLNMDKTLAQLTSEEKNKISHRARAVNHFLKFLSSSQT